MNLTLPDQPELLANVGSACRISNQFDAAAACLNRSLQLNLARAETWNNRGQLHEDLGEFGEAYTAYQNAYSLNRTHPVIALSLAYQRMRAGEWSNEPWLPAGAPEGTTPFPGTWDLWEQGRNNYGTLPNVPIWKGEDLTGDRLLITPEGGYGDYVWLSRYLPKLEKMGAKVFFMVPEPIVRLARERFPGNNRYIHHTIEGVPVKTFDYQVPLLSLLSRFLRDPCNTPPAALQANTEAPRASSGHFKRTGESLRVGLVSLAQENGVQRPHRSIPLLAIQPLREVAGVEWVSLMPDRRTDWMRSMRWIKDADGLEWDWLDTCEVIEQLDLVVTVDTAVAHLAASLGVPTWILVPMRSDHKWGTSERSAWYPDAKLFRQRDPISWDGVISEVCAELKVLLQAEHQAAQIG